MDRKNTAREKFDNWCQELTSTFSLGQHDDKQIECIVTPEEMVFVFVREHPKYEPERDYLLDYAPTTQKAIAYSGYPIVNIAKWNELKSKSVGKVSGS